MGLGHSWLLKSLFKACLAVCVVANVRLIDELARFTHDYFTSRLVFRLVAFVCDEKEGVTLFRYLNEEGGMQITVRTHPGRLTDQIGNSFTGVLLLTDCPFADIVLKESSSNSLLFNSSIIWLLAGMHTNNVNLDETPVRLDSEFTMAQLVTDELNNTKWVLREVFRLDPRPEIVVRPAGFWDSYYGFVPPWENCLTIRRRNISGVRIRTGLFLEKVFSEEALYNLASLNKDDSIKAMTYMAMHSHLCHLNAVQMLNISVTLLQHLDPGQLEPRANESFVGVLGYIEQGEAEVVGSGMILTRGRMRVLAYPAIVWRLRSVFVFLSPYALGSIEALAKPFSTSVWICLLLLSVVVILLSRIIGFFEHYAEESWGSAMISVFGTITAQGFFITVERASGRMLVLSFEVFCLITYGFYSAAVVTFLLRPPDTTIRTPADMIGARFRAAVHDWLHTIRSITVSTEWS